VHFQTFLVNVRHLFASILQKYITGGAMMKKYEAHREKMREYYESERRMRRHRIRARRRATAKNSLAAQAGNYNRPRHDDREVLDEACEMAKRDRDLSPSSAIPDTVRKRWRSPLILTVPDVLGNVLSPAPP
jgi:hypothetical protein